jgi:DNA-directed RNA polymerase subunit M/transcription elongation factor TFIIS
MKCENCSNLMEIKGNPQFHHDYVEYVWICRTCGKTKITRDYK